VHKAQSDRPKLTADMLKLMKTQDRTYVQTMKNSEDAKIGRLRASLHRVREAEEGGSGHMKFDEEGEEAGEGAAAGAADVWLDQEELEEAAAAAAAAKVAAGRKRRRAAEEEEEEEEEDAAGGGRAAAGGAPLDKAAQKAARKQRRTLEKERRKSYTELERREARSAKLGVLAAHMDVSRALLQKGRRVKVADAQGDAPPQYKWRTERKR
jgi:U3 small nucleolar RNA-associated protein 11